jgi:hypothetical protein
MGELIAGNLLLEKAAGKRCSCEDLTGTCGREAVEGKARSDRARSVTPITLRGRVAATTNRSGGASLSP